MSIDTQRGAGNGETSELAAMETAYKALAGLDPRARLRCWRWLCSALGYPELAGDSDVLPEQAPIA